MIRFHALYTNERIIQNTRTEREPHKLKRRHTSAHLWRHPRAQRATIGEELRDEAPVGTLGGGGPAETPRFTLSGALRLEPSILPARRKAPGGSSEGVGRC